MYTFKINIGSYSNPVVGGGYVSCYPILDGIKLKKSRDTNYPKVVRLKVEGELKFKDSPSGTDHFTALKTLLDTDVYYVPIQIYYNNVLKLTGRLDLFGTWDLNKHLCGLKIVTEDSYSTFLKELDTEIDIKEVNAVTAKTNVTSFLTTQVSEPTQVTASAMALTMFTEEYVDLWLHTGTQVIPGTPITYIYTYTASSLYFEAIGYKYYPVTRLCHKPIATTEVVQDSFNRFRLMVSVLDYIFDEISIGITVNPSTYCPYFDEDTEMKYLMIADKSDIKRHDASDQAPFEYIKIKDFIEIYKNISNLDWYIDGTSFKLVYPGAYDLANLTTYPEHDFTQKGYYVNLQKFEFDIENKVFKEVWSFEETRDLDFRKQEIVYYNFETNKKEYSRADINMDFEYVTTGQSDTSDNGVVIVATSLSSGTYYIINKTGLATARPFINGKLATSHIINDHFKGVDRPYTRGEFLGNNIVLGVGNNKKIEYTNVPIFDQDLINFDYAINTEFGLVVPEELEIDLSGKNFSTFIGRINPVGIVTIQPFQIDDTSAYSGGIIDENVGLTIIARGVCYSENHNPTLSDIFTTNGTGTGEFSSYITSLTPETTYYVRAYLQTATNVIYGNEYTFSTTETATYTITDINVINSGNTATANMTVTSSIDMIIRFRFQTITWYEVDETITAGTSALAVSLTKTISRTVKDGSLFDIIVIIDGIETYILNHEQMPYIA